MILKHLHVYQFIIFSIIFFLHVHFPSFSRVLILCRWIAVTYEMNVTLWREYSTPQLMWFQTSHLQVTGTILFKQFTKLVVQYHETEVNDNNLKVRIIIAVCSGNVNNPHHVPNMVLHVKPEIPYIWNTVINILHKGQCKGKH